MKQSVELIRMARKAHEKEESVRLKKFLSSYEKICNDNEMFICAGKNGLYVDRKGFAERSVTGPTGIEIFCSTINKIKSNMKRLWPWERMECNCKCHE